MAREKREKKKKVNKNQRRSEVMCITFIEHIMFTILLWESSKTAIYVCISRESKLWFNRVENFRIINMFLIQFFFVFDNFWMMFLVVERSHRLELDGIFFLRQSYLIKRKNVLKEKNSTCYPSFSEKDLSSSENRLIEEFRSISTANFLKSWISFTWRRDEWKREKTPKTEFNQI